MKQGMIFGLLCFGLLIAPERVPGAGPAQGGPVGGASSAPAANGTAALVLGAVTPRFTAERSGTCVGVIVNGTLYLFDLHVRRWLPSTTRQADSAALSAASTSFTNAEYSGRQRFRVLKNNKFEPICQHRLKHHIAAAIATSAVALLS